MAAYMSPENHQTALFDALESLKVQAGVRGRLAELKLRELPEATYFSFLENLKDLDGVVFAVACDAGLQTENEIRAHQSRQGDMIEEHKDKMHFDAARDGLVDFANRIRQIAPQLYLQLFCHALLVFSMISRGIPYFVQRLPHLLGAFRWRIDQKNASKNVFEDSYQLLLLPLLQSMSLGDPILHLEDADYSAFKRFEFPQGQAPTYLKDDYGIDIAADPGFDIGKLIREDFSFEESVSNDGVQVADLVNSGLRRCLRGRFSDNDSAARLLGALMIQDMPKRPPLRLVAFGERRRVFVDETAERAIAVIQRHCRPFLSQIWLTTSEV